MPIWKQCILFFGFVSITACSLTPTPYNKSRHYLHPDKTKRVVKPKVVVPSVPKLTKEQRRIECIITFTDRKVDGLTANKICSDIFKNR